MKKKSAKAKLIKKTTPKMNNVKAFGNCSCDKGIGLRGNTVGSIPV